MSKVQVLCVTGCYLGVIALTYPEDLNRKQFELMFVEITRDHFWGVITSILASIFGAFNYLAVRRISKKVHSSVKTMYLGIIGMLVSSIFIACYRPQYFKLWKSYTVEQFLFCVVISALFYISQESLSIALENGKAANVAPFGFLAILI